MRDAKENRVEMAARTPGHFFLAVFFRVTHDGHSKRGTIRSLNWLKSTNFHEVQIFIFAEIKCSHLFPARESAFRFQFIPVILLWISICLLILYLGLPPVVSPFKAQEMRYLAVIAVFPKNREDQRKFLECLLFRDQSHARQADRQTDRQICLFGVLYNK